MAAATALEVLVGQPGVDPVAVATDLAGELRQRSVTVTASAVMTFVEALGHVDVRRRADVYWAGRATLVVRPEHHHAYALAFGVVFGGSVSDDAPDHDHDHGADEGTTTTVVRDDGDDDDRPASDDHDDHDDRHDDDPDDGGDVHSLRFSVAEVLRHRDFADYSPAELAEARRLMTRLRLTGSSRRSRRLTPTRRRTRRPDLRRTLRAAVRAQGEPVSRHFRRPATTPRRLVLILDVSGSMAAYSRALLRFVHAAVATRRRVEAFAVGTRLTRITRELGVHDPDLALDRAATRVVDWSGGTRLGDGLAEFNRRWGLRGMARGADVVILSDGWDRGDPDVVAAEMERLRRAAHRVVWVNPLKVTAGYAPLARGMAAALPHVDHFVEGNSLAALDRLLALLADTSPPSPYR